MTALLMPLSAFEMYADNENTAMKIPLSIKHNTDLGRSLNQESIVSYYQGMMSVIQTSVITDLGVLEVMVVNCSSGEFWYDSFDSSEETQTILQISGESGLYEITYTTESGDVYEGVFVIN